MPILERQLLNVSLLAALLVGVRLLADADPEIVSGSFLGLGAGTWLLLAVAVPVLHQLYVAFAWRTELHLGLWNRWFPGRAFARYKVGFTILILARPLTVLALAVANGGSLPLPAAVAWPIGVVCLVPPLYLAYSIHRFFTLDRAYGIDHFDASYREAPLVRQGIFRWSKNAMYVFGFLALWAIAFLFRSKGALVAAGFNHAAIWVHYLCTERPDMRRIYGES